jgi:glycosyltransferase involved in cell wall biosynthesis
MTASIIVPTFGSRIPYLRDALYSLQNQDYPPDEYEILVVDNSPDGRLAPLIEEMNHKGKHFVRYLREGMAGLHRARHAGAKQATGEVLVYIDDDVIVHRQWLEAMMRPFSCDQVACVGGKVIAQWETEIPEWFSQFEKEILSLLDLGTQPLELKYPQFVWGCNMAVRKETLFRIGGFNPDGIGDRRLIWLRGDGECGLEKKIYDLGLKIIYEPEAWLYHRIPASRMKPEAFYQTYFRNGIMSSYMRIRDLKQKNYLFIRLLKGCIDCYAKSLLYVLKSILRYKYRVWLRSNAWFWYGRGSHHLRASLDKKLLQHVLKNSYL